MIYNRDLTRGAIFLRTPKPPPLGTRVHIDLSLPSDSMIELSGAIVEHLGEGGMGGRGPGVDIRLAAIPQAAMWMIESALASHKSPPPSARPASRAPSVADSGLDDGEDFAAAETELVGALTAELASLQLLNPFQVLGVSYDVGDPEVRAAFGELTRRYHPDRYAKYPSLELRRLAAEIFILIRDAYHKIDHEPGRQKELAVLGRHRAGAAREPARSPGLPARVPSSAVSPNQRGLVGAGARATPAGGVPIQNPPLARGAAPVVRAATTPPVPAASVLPEAPAGSPPLGPGAGSATPNAREAGRGGDGKTLHQGAFEALLDGGKFDEALAMCQLALTSNPGDRTARAGAELVEGLRALGARDRLEAAQRFEAVLGLDPANERAARELAEMRRVATNERKGLLTKLLGKKD